MNMRTIATNLALGSVALALGGCETVPTPPATFLDGTRWAVIDVNGVNVQERSDFYVTFSGSRFEGRFGCRIVSGNYTLRITANGSEQPVFQGSEGRFSGEPCLGTLPEEIGPELMVNATFSVARPSEGRMNFLQPPTGIAFRQL